MLFVCYLCLGHKVNLLLEVIHGISFTGSVECFFPCSYLLYGVGGTGLNAVLFLSAFIADIKGEYLFTGDVTVSCC